VSLCEPCLVILGKKGNFFWRTVLTTIFNFNINRLNGPARVDAPEQAGFESCGGTSSFAPCWPWSSASPCSASTGGSRARVPAVSAAAPARGTAAPARPHPIGTKAGRRAEAHGNRYAEASSRPFVFL